MFSSHSGWTNRIGLAVAVLSAAAVLAARLGVSPLAAAAADLLYLWALLLGGFALLLGIAYTLWRHVGRIQRGQREWALSLVLLLVFAGVLVAGLSTEEGGASPLVEWVFDAILAPGQATLFALSGLFLAGAAYRYLRLDRPGALWILGGALLTLFVQTPSARGVLPEVLVTLMDWLLVWPVMAALRGVLIGGGLAVLFVSLRLFLKSAR